MKRILALVLSFALFVVITLSCGSIVTVYAIEELQSSGSCGNNAQYTFDSSTGELIISCVDTGENGSIEEDFMGEKDIVKVTLEEGIVGLPGYTFSDCTSLEEISLPASIGYIGRTVFHYCTSLHKVNYNGTVEQWNEIDIDINNNDSLTNAEIICTDGTTSFQPPQHDYPYSSSDVTDVEFYAARDIFAGVDNYEAGIDAKLTMNDGKSVVVSMEYVYKYDYDKPYGGKYELNNAFCEFFSFEFRYKCSGVEIDKDGIVQETGTMDVTIESDLKNPPDYTFNTNVKLNVVNSPVSSISVTGDSVRKVRISWLKNGIIGRNDIKVEYSNNTTDTLDRFLDDRGWINGLTKHYYKSFFDTNIYTEEYENNELDVRSSKARRHSVEYVVDTDLDSVEVGDTIPMVIKYMGKSVTTYIEAVEDSYIEDNPTATNTPEPSKSPKPSNTPEPSNTPQPTAAPEATNTPDVTQTPAPQPTTTPIMITATQTPTPTPDMINNQETTSDSTTKLKSFKLTSVKCKKGAKQISGKVSVSGATVKIKVGSKAYKKATVKGKKFTLKVSRLKKNTKVTIKVTKSGYKSLVKTYKVK